jgi:DNA-binding MarR family transcriptional regulator
METNQPNETDSRAPRGRLQQELKKRRPFASPHQEAVLNLLRTADRLQLRFERLFRPYGLTPAQYNVLRILRGEGGPLPILEAAARTITAVPGITGLVDRLERAGLVCRRRSSEDRRVVFVSATPRALELLAELDGPLEALHKDMVGALSRAELDELIRLLEKARCANEAAAP